MHGTISIKYLSYVFSVIRGPIISFVLSVCFVGSITNMRHLTTGILSEKCAVKRFRRCANVIDCTYTNLDSTVKPTTHLGYTV